MNAHQPRSTTPLRTQVERLRGRRDALVGQVASAKAEVDRLEGEVELTSLVQEAIRLMIDREVTSGVEAVEALLTEGLRSVFYDQNLRVKSDVSVSRGKVSVGLNVVHEREDGQVIQGMPNDAFGGAVSTVLSILLRILVIKRRGLRPLLLLDEALPAFDAGYVHNMGDFLREICSRLGVDILLVTQKSAFEEAADRAYQLVRTKSGARVEVGR